MSSAVTAATLSAHTAQRRSPNRQRLIARVALWTVVFPAISIIVPRLLF